MSLILLGDMHVTSQNPVCRTDNFLEAQNAKLDFLIEYANNTSSNILSAGDQTDRPRDFLSLWILANKLKKLNKNLGFYYVSGQHDRYSRSDQPSSMKILQEFGYVRKLSSEPTVIDEWNVFGCDFGDDPIDPKTENNILVAHDSICTHELSIKNVKIKDAEEYANKNKKYEYIIVSDIHRRFLVKTKYNTILNSGVMLRDDASDYYADYEPSFYFLENDNIKMVKFPSKPDVISRKHILVKSESKIDFNIAKTGNVDIIKIINDKIKKKENRDRLREIIF